MPISNSEAKEFLRPPHASRGRGLSPPNATLKSTTVDFNVAFRGARDCPAVVSSATGHPSNSLVRARLWLTALANGIPSMCSSLA
jgi:hypothetical protein